MSQKLKVKSGGYIALMSAIIISVILLTLVTTSNFSGFYSRFNILDSELKERSEALAEACVNHAFLALAIDPAYDGDETVPISGHTCHIYPIVSNIIQTKGIYSNFHTNLQVSYNSGSLSINYWEEIPNL